MRMRSTEKGGAASGKLSFLDFFPDFLVFPSSSFFSGVSDFCDS